jgi:hypothetical protein
MGGPQGATPIASLQGRTTHLMCYVRAHKGMYVLDMLVPEMAMLIGGTQFGYKKILLLMSWNSLFNGFRNKILDFCMAMPLAVQNGCLDSGCTTNRMIRVKGRDEFIDVINSTSSIPFGDNTKGMVLGNRKKMITKDLSLQNVILIKSFSYNLLSIYHLADASYDSYFSKHHVKVFRSDNLTLVLVGYVEHRIYVVDLS